MLSFFKTALNFLGAFLAHNYLLLLFILTLFWTFDFSEKRTDGLIWSDAEGYYMYLPAVFIYDGFEQLPVRTKEQFKPFGDTNKYFTKYTFGVALMQLPFFLVFHLVSQFTGEPADGYSFYYICSIYMAAAFYAFIGLFFVRRILERNFSGWISLLTILALYFGTNLYYYTTREAGMSHVYSFCLFAIFIYYTPDFYKRVKFRTFAFFGMLAGLIVLIRPTNALILLYLIFYNIHSWHDMMARLRFYLKNILSLLTVPVFSFLIFLPQFYYWYYITGDYVYYSYEEEGFINWNNPQVLKVLFDIKNGWLLFNPIAGVAILGCFFGLRKNRYNIGLIFFILLLAIYTFSSWHCWWFGGAYGHRTFVEFYTLLAIPFAYISHLVFRQKNGILKIGYLLVLSLLVYYNMELIQYYVGPHYTWISWNMAIDKMF